MTATHSSLSFTYEAAFSSFSLCERRSFRTFAPFGIWIIASKKGRLIWASPSLGFSLSIAALVSSAGAELGGVGYGGSWVVVPNLVVIAKVGALCSGVSESCSLSFLKLPSKVGFIISGIEEIFIAGAGSSQVLSWYWTYSSIRLHPSSSLSWLKRSWKRIQVSLMGSLLPWWNRMILSLMVEVCTGGKNLSRNLDTSCSHVVIQEGISRESKIFPVCSPGKTIGFWKPAELGEEYSLRLLIGGITMVSELMTNEVSSSKRFLPAMAKDSFRC
ncbi:hypothetical protein Tco_0241623 [Tanacetum coccineum]